MRLKSESHNETPGLSVLCYPHLGTLDNWLPVVNKVNNLLESHANCMLIIPDISTVRSFHRDNAVVKISHKIFNTVLIHAYENIWIEHESVYRSMNWYKNNHAALRLFVVLKGLVKNKLYYYALNWLFILLRNKLYKKESRIDIKELNRVVFKDDILFYDIHAEGNSIVLDILRLFENNYKYSLPHQLAMLNAEKKVKPINIKNKDNIEVYVYAKFQSKKYNLKYKVDANKIHVVGIPRHDSRWIETIQEESPRLPSSFDDDNTIVIFSLHIIPFQQKVETIRNIKKIFIDGMNMKVVIKLHPNEKQEKVYADKGNKIYEDVFGLGNYGLTWVYSDIHVFALAKGKRLAICMHTGVVFDLIAMHVPCVDYVDSPIEFETPSKMKQFVKYGFVEGASSYQELCSYTDKWTSDPKKISTSSINIYNKYFPTLDNISRKIAIEILNKE